MVRSRTYSPLWILPRALYSFTAFLSLNRQLRRPFSRAIYTLLCVFPISLQAEPLHIFSNGEIADADKINDNFTSLDTQVRALKGQPQNDAATIILDWSTQRTVRLEEQNDLIDLTNEGRTATLTKSTGIATISGIQFHSEIRQILRLDLLSTVEHPKCPDADFWIPFMGNSTYFNAAGGFVLTGPTQTDEQLLDPNNNETGVVCGYSGSDPRFVSVVTLSVYGGVGAYKCASGTVNLAAPPSDAEATGSTIDYPQNPDGVVLRMREVDSSLTGSGLITIPASCP